MRRRALVTTTLALAACASEPAATPDSGVPMTATETYSGLLAGPNDETGVLELIVPVASSSGALRTAFAPNGVVRGTLVLNTAIGAITLTGTVDASGATVNFRGTASGAFGTFECNADLIDGSLRGKCTGADGRTRHFDSRLIGLKNIARYCGTWTDPTGNPAGPFNVITHDTYAAAIFNSSLVSGVAIGTISGADVTLTIVPIGTVNGQISDTLISGTWTVPAIGGGTFEGGTERCPTTAGPPPRDAGVAQPDAAAPDANTPRPDAAVSSDATVSADAGGPAAPACPSSARMIVPFATPLATSVIAAADGYVFYQDDIFIMRAARDGSSLDRFVQLSNPVLDMVAGEGHLCYAEGSLDPTRNSFIQCKAITGTSSAAFVVSGATAPIQIAMSSGHLYWVSRGTVAVWRAEMRRGSPLSQIVGAIDLPSTNAITEVAATRDNVYFSHETTPSDVAVYSCPVTRVFGDQTRPVVRSTAGQPVQFMSSDGERVYWLRYALQSPQNTFGRIEGFDEGTGSFGTVDYQPQNPGSLVVDDGLLYFSAGTGLAKMGPTEMVPTPLHGGRFSWTAERPDLPLAVDDSCMFWVALERGQQGILAGPK